MRSKHLTAIINIIVNISSSSRELAAAGASDSVCLLHMKSIIEASCQLMADAIHRTAVVHQSLQLYIYSRHANLCGPERETLVDVLSGRVLCGCNVLIVPASKSYTRLASVSSGGSVFRGQSVSLCGLYITASDYRRMWTA